MVVEVSKIQIDTPASSKQAELCLCLGDITDISVSTESHDIIMISAYPGDYSAVPSTLIGALKSRFGLNVRDLARDKAEDLRNNFNCWISKPLPEGLPYKRLLCFEQNALAHRARTPEKAVGEIFRALFTVFADNLSVISPLLATGCQHAVKSRIMHGLVTAWHTWVTIGLPMSRYTLVIYTSRMTVESLSADDQKAVTEFKRLKAAFEGTQVKVVPVPIENDLFVICSERDVPVLERTVRSLKSALPTFRCRKVVHSDDSSSSSSGGASSSDDDAADGGSAEKGKSDPMDSRRGEMLASRLVVCLLSQAFIGTRACVEDFNVAMCLGHTQHHPFLPLCLEKLDNPPTYMSIIQWADCRPKADDPMNVDKLSDAIGDIASRLGQLRLLDGSASQLGSQSSLSRAKPTSGRSSGVSSPPSYDIFISYSHRDSAEVAPFLAELQRSCPKLSIFFDKEGIKTGFSWMEVIYGAVSRSRLIIAFVTPDYLKSVVCAEEFAIGSLLHRSDHFQSLMLSVCLKPVSIAAPVFRSLARWIDATKPPEQSAKRLAVAVAKLMQPAASSGDKKLQHLKEQLFPDCRKFASYDSRIDKLRQSLLKNPGLHTQPAVDAFKAAVSAQSLPVVDLCHVALVFHPDEREPIVESVYQQLLAFSPELQLRCLDSDKSNDDLEAIEQAKAVAIFLSPVFLTSARLTSLLYLALCRKRSQAVPLLLFCLNGLPKLPAFLSLLPINASMEDIQLLASMYRTHSNTIEGSVSDASKLQFMKLSVAETAFAFTCARAILERLYKLQESLSTTPCILISLAELEAGEYLSDPSEEKPWRQKMEPI